MLFALGVHSCVWFCSVNVTVKQLCVRPPQLCVRFQERTQTVEELQTSLDLKSNQLTAAMQNTTMLEETLDEQLCSLAQQESRINELEAEAAAMQVPNTYSSPC